MHCTQGWEKRIATVNRTAWHRCTRVTGKVFRGDGTHRSAGEGERPESPAAVGRGLPGLPDLLQAAVEPNRQAHEAAGQGRREAQEGQTGRTRTGYAIPFLPEVVDHFEGYTLHWGGGLRRHARSFVAGTGSAPAGGNRPDPECGYRHRGLTYGCRDRRRVHYAPPPKVVGGGEYRPG